MNAQPASSLQAQVRAAALDCARRGEPAVVVEVSAARGSVPREAGTRMLVTAAGVVGTVGGGHLEFKAVEAAQGWLDRGGALPGPAQFALGPALGQCCGGAVTLAFQALDTAAAAAWPAAPPRFDLTLFGAGHVGQALVRVLEPIDCRVRWIDEREDRFPPRATLPPHIERVCVDAVEAEVAAAPAGAFFLVMTHSHDLDLRLSRAILERGDFGFFGLIGSRSKRQRFERRLIERGIAAGALGRMHCPIGLPGIAGKEPEVIALAVAAQLLQMDGGTPH